MRQLLALVVFVAPVFAATPSVADVTMTISISSTTNGSTSEASSVIYVKGMKARIDLKDATQHESILQDVVVKQQLWVDHITKLVHTSDPKASMAKLAASMSRLTVSFNPSGQTKEILGRTCTGYTMRVSLPVSESLNLTADSHRTESRLAITFGGPVWLATSGRDVAEWLAFSRAAAAAAMLMVFPPFRVGSQFQGIAEMQKVYTENGVPFESELQLKFEGSDPEVQKYAAITTVMTMKVTAISTDPIPDDVFTIPAGYTKK